MKDFFRALFAKVKHKLSENGTKVRWLLVLYDFLIYLSVVNLLYLLWGTRFFADNIHILHVNVFGGLVCIFGCRFLLRIYNQVWRYGDISAFLLLGVADVAGGILWTFYDVCLGENGMNLSCVLLIAALNLLASYAIRMVYYYLYRYASHRETSFRNVFNALTGSQVHPDEAIRKENRIKIAILGAGRVGTSLLNELNNNVQAPYDPVCFIDNNKNKAGRAIGELPILSEENLKKSTLTDLGVQEIVFAVPEMEAENRKALYTRYTGMGFPVKVYDFPIMETMGRRSIRDFDVEELLFRQKIEVDTEETARYYRGKVVLITGGGGSIGSEICRQLARMQPKKLIVLDIAENGSYDVQQELKLIYGNSLDLGVEIASVRDKEALRRIFAEHRPQVVVMAAAHKHVPLMEKNCIEAVENNVFGTLNTVEAAEEFGVERVIMVSTDKAVNPTNVMGATKRLCEMIVLAHSVLGGGTTFSATRFGNVLGSAGSVIPLFKRQIAKGGPVTITDKRIIRYFMTIPEASQLVLQSGALAQNGELFVLDMGRPVKIYDLATNMIRLSGLEPGRDIEIQEIGLRPGEKLYEELLIQSENLTRTKNNLIFIEKDTPLSMEEVQEKLKTLRTAIENGTDEGVREALQQVVPTYRPKTEKSKTIA